MRKLCFLIGTCAVASLAFSAPALATHTGLFDFHDPLCREGSGYKPLGIYGQEIRTDTLSAWTVAKSTGKGYACSGRAFNPFDPSTDGSLFERLDVWQPLLGVVRKTVDRDDWHGRFVGRACVGAVSSIGYVGRPGQLGVGPCPGETRTTITVDNRRSNRDCIKPEYAPWEGFERIACFYGETPLGHAWIWVDYESWGWEDWGAYNLTIGPFHPLVGKAGLTRIEPYDASQVYNPPFQCDYLGRAGTTTCGSEAQGDPWLFRTGWAIEPEDREQCEAPGGYSSDYWTGTYWLWATTRDGDPTDGASTCIPWQWE